ncbi:serine/threonine-protein phosphatase [Nocardioides sp. ChNu-153]|uniref:PP2C family protein-serine/threonine phosphatase n=1 Tax=unclassified Nocardioides TaxID=2615069 RepID=UPI0024058FB5|nr:MULTISPECIES: PP2C family serine/threonine-protein phosphatase [unclassified Nocardioides]MDF9715641.1 serine/threonine-protein phosphatase [Nocardioides sp. ChNu-99]MDN7121313.1 serine/threonine-protein phosphatase [Nocardioides sp. ChNu-153]
MARHAPAPVPFDTDRGAASDVGVRRRENEDAWHADDRVCLVADGMGGHHDGAAAAALVARTLAEQPWTYGVDAAGLRAAVSEASRRVAGLADGAGAAPGSTLTGVAVAEQDGRAGWLVFHLGQSRAYLLRDGALTCLTTDHTRRQELLDQGVGVAGADVADDGHVLTRALGAGQGTAEGDAPELDVTFHPARAGDRVLLCTDGVCGELTDQLVTAVLLAHPDPRLAAETLVAAAVDAGGRDNATAVVLDARRTGRLATGGGR